MSHESPTAHITDVSPEGMSLFVHAFGEARAVFAPALHPHAEKFFVDSCAEEENFAGAVEVWVRKMEPYISLRPSRHPAASVVIDGLSRVSGDDLVAWGRLLARLQTPECKTVMVCGGVVIEPTSDYDTLGALAAALIRQRLGQFIGVGLAAKPLATQVGLEGSWDGESVWADTPARAYDYLCDQVHESDVVVVVGLSDPDIADLMSRWGGVVR